MNKRHSCSLDFHKKINVDLKKFSTEFSSLNLDIFINYCKTSKLAHSQAFWSFFDDIRGIYYLILFSFVHMHTKFSSMHWKKHTLTR